MKAKRAKNGKLERAEIAVELIKQLDGVSIHDAKQPLS